MTLLEYLKLNEAKADVEYEKSYSSIDREIFNKICLMDPKTQRAGDDVINIGFGAKQLLLPKYMAGETDFIDNSEVVFNALNSYYPNIKVYPKFPQFNSVAEFLAFMENPVESDPEAVAIQQENKIDKVYNDYYSQIPREEFDKIIALDPDTTDNKIGDIAKNLLLRQYVRGDKNWLKNIEQIETAINRYKDLKETYPREKQDLMSYTSIQEFIDYLPESRTISSLTNTQYAPIKGTDFIHIASTPNYDIFRPLTYRGSERIAHAQGAQNVWCTAGGSDGTHYSASRDHSRPTTYWTQYTSDPNHALYMFMHKSEPQNRKKNFNMSMKNGAVYEFRDGENHAPHGGWEVRDGIHQDWNDFLIANPEVAFALRGSSEKQLANETSVAIISQQSRYENKPYIIKSNDDMYAFIKNTKILRGLVKELEISGIAKIPSGLASNFIVLRSIKFGPGVIEIGAQAFKNCANLTRIDQTLPEGLTIIGEEAFMNCTQLRGSIHVPESLEQVKLRAFDGTHCKLKIDRNRTKPIKFAAADRQWVISHVLSIKK